MNPASIPTPILDEGLNPFEIFPEEVWLTIFERITDSRDFHSIYQASPSFQMLLREKKPAILFPQVVGQLRKGYLCKWDLYKCRLVCQSWKEGIDNFNENKLSQMDIWQHGQYPYKHLQYIFEDRHKLSSFLLNMEAFHSNPFVKQRVTLCCTNSSQGSRDSKLHHRQVLKLLGKFGSEILYLQLGYNVTIPKEKEIQSILWTIEQLALVPNVKVLILTFGSYEKKTGINMEEYLEEHPLPQMRNVEQMKIICVKKICPLEPTILKMCCDPEKLSQISVCNLPEFKDFPNLIAIDTGLTEINYKILERSSWQLKKLRLEYSVFTTGETFEAIMKFKNTLTTLILEEVDSEELEDLKVDLPYLTHFQLETLFGTLDFLTNIPSLERFQVENYTDGMFAGKRITAEEVDHKVETNITDVLPHVKYIGIRYQPEVNKGRLCSCNFNCFSGRVDSDSDESTGTIL